MRVNHAVKTCAAVNTAGPVGPTRPAHLARVGSHEPVKVIAPAATVAARKAAAGPAVRDAVRAGAEGLDPPATVVVGVIGAPAAPAQRAWARARASDTR